MAARAFDVVAVDVSDRAVEYAKEKAAAQKVAIEFLVGDFVHLPFREGVFDFAFDFGCFHHVAPAQRPAFIDGVSRALTAGGTYLLVCFSEANGPAWNHFQRAQLVQLFREAFNIGWIHHIRSREGDGVTRYFYEVLMHRAR